MANQQTEKSPAPKKPDGKHAEGRKDLIDETVWESFPVSDPGASWAGRDIPPDERKKKG